MENNDKYTILIIKNRLFLEASKLNYKSHAKKKT